MRVLKPRSRMISIRLSEEEYSALRHLCSLNGKRSLSDLTRDAVHTVLMGTVREPSVGGPLEEFRTGMKDLEKKIEQLEAKLTIIRPDEKK